MPECQVGEGQHVTSGGGRGRPPLGVEEERSTAHRLLSMLVFRDFAVQDGSNAYVPGPALLVVAVEPRPTQELVRRVIPWMRELRDRYDETVQLSVRSNRWVRFIATVECTQYLRVGDRRGTVLPAHAASGGRALLAELSTAQLARLYRMDENCTETPARDDASHLTAAQWNSLADEMDTIRRRGFALNVRDTEPGVRAIGAVVHGRNHQAVAAMSIAAPVIRMPGHVIEEMGKTLVTVCKRADEDLSGYPD